MMMMRIAGHNFFCASGFSGFTGKRNSKSMFVGHAGVAVLLGLALVLGCSPYAAAQQSIWPGTIVPAAVDNGPSGPVELGVSFKADVSGTVNAIRFYKSSANTGLHVAHLWTSTGTLLASATFVGETASGWQQVNFSTPVAIKANTFYIASYDAANGHWSANWY